jgi:hypothetical protein
MSAGNQSRSKIVSPPSGTIQTLESAGSADISLKTASFGGTKRQILTTRCRRLKPRRRRGRSAAHVTRRVIVLPNEEVT